MARFIPILSFIITAFLVGATVASAIPKADLASRDGAEAQLERRDPTPNTEGYYVTKFYKFWSDGGSSLATFQVWNLSTFL